MSKTFVKPKIDVLATRSDYSLSTTFVNLFIDDVFQIVSTIENFIALTKKGQVYGRGINGSGELALGDSFSRDDWTLIPFPCKVKQIACKQFHSLFLTEEGQVYTCGSNTDGQLGIGNTIEKHFAQPILKNKKAIKVVSGMGSFSFVLCEHNDDCALCENTMIDSCENDDFSTNESFVISTSRPKTVLYAFGLNDYGQLGVNKKEISIHTPTIVHFFNNKSDVQDVQAGRYNTVVLLKNGSLYVMGKKKFCGQMFDGNFYLPVLVSVGNFVQSICCSYYFTIFQTVNDEWYVFGRENRRRSFERQSDLGICSNVKYIPLRKTLITPKGFKIQKLVATESAFFILGNGNELYEVGNRFQTEMAMTHEPNSNNWFLRKTNVVDVQTSLFQLFVFIHQSFLIYEPAMKWTDITVITVNQKVVEK